MTTITDDFNRSDSTTVLGGPWSLYSTSGSLSDVDFGIISSKGYISRSATVSSHSTEGRAYVDLAADFDMTITVSNTANFNEHGVMFRMKTDGSCWHVDGQGLWQAGAVSGNSYTLTDGAGGTVVPMVGFGARTGVIRVMCAGTSIKVWVDGTLAANVANSFNLTATRHGWFGNATFAGDARFDDFSINTLSRWSVGSVRIA